MADEIIIFDLDGTLADIEHRRHFVRGPADRGIRPPPGHPDNNWKPDWDAFYQACVDDLPNQPVIDMWQTLRSSPRQYILWILSGRSEVVRPKTEFWLEMHHIAPHRLLMRPEGDNTPDEQLKRFWVEGYEDRIKYVFDDRNKVVKMWRSLGITCFQVADGDF